VVDDQSEVDSSEFGSISSDRYWITFQIDVPGKARPHHQLQGLGVGSCRYTLLAPDAGLMRDIENVARKAAEGLEAHAAWRKQKEQLDEQAQVEAGTTPTQTETVTGQSQPSSAEASPNPR
jgi:hypothetical protein